MGTDRTGHASAVRSAGASTSRSLLSVHRAFLVGIILKGLNGLLEIAGGTLAYFTSPAAIRAFVANITRHELLEDPHDFVATHLLRLAAHFSASTKLFLTLYLLSHGIVKLLLVISLWRRRLWAYPAAIVVFALFIIYQLYRYNITHAFSLVLLTLLDLVVIVLTVLEYRNVKRDALQRKHVLNDPESSVL